MNETRKQFPRMMALFLAVIMILAMVPGSVFASETVPPETEIVTEAAEVTETIPSSAEDQTEESKTGPPETPAETESALAETQESHLAEETTPEATAENEPAKEEMQNAGQVEKTVLTEPVQLDTEVQIFEKYYALMAAVQDNLQYHILTKDAVYQNPSIRAYTFEVDPEVPSIGFEIHLDGVDFFQENNVNPGAEVTVDIDGTFRDSEPADIAIVQISGDDWIPLAVETCEKDGDTVHLSFYTTNINSRYAVVERSSSASTLEEYYGTGIGDPTWMSVTNKGNWCVTGRNHYGFGNSKMGTFDIHLVSASADDYEGKGIGYKDYTAAGCLEYWKAAPSIQSGQIVTSNEPGYIGGWADLSTEQRCQITAYMLYGTRYLSDYSFPAKGTPINTNTSNTAVNLCYAQQILVWSVVKGVDPHGPLSCYGQSVPHYGQQIMDLAAENPEGYD